MMFKSTLAAATLATLLAAPGFADDKPGGDGHDRFRGEHGGYRHDDGRYDHGRQDRHWRHVPLARYRYDFGYRAGYESGWRDSERNCRLGYRQGRWYRDPRYDYWYFGFDFGG